MAQHQQPAGPWSNGASELDWQQYAGSLLPEHGCPFARNQRVTSLYAELYLQHPLCFKWAGMAAYASHHVRLALLPLRLSTGPTRCQATDIAGRRHATLSTRDVDLLRQTNDRIFSDIYWAHLVYGGTPEGLRALAALLGEDRQQMLAGFQSIEEGRLLLDHGTPEQNEEGERLIWEGNARLLRHEQEVMVQPLFDKLSTPFSHAFSIASSLGFSTGRAMEHFRNFCSFYVYMATGGIRGRKRPPLIPNIRHFPDRWLWISQCILPKFRHFESSPGSPIQSQLRAFVDLAGSNVAPGPATEESPT